MLSSYINSSDLQTSLRNQAQELHHPYRLISASPSSPSTSTLHTHHATPTSKYPAASQPSALLLLCGGDKPPPKTSMAPFTILSSQENDIPATRLPLERNVLCAFLPRQPKGQKSPLSSRAYKLALHTVAQLTGLGRLCTDEDILLPADGFSPWSQIRIEVSKGFLN